MKTRNKTYLDYGVSIPERNKILEHCRSPGFDGKDLLKEIAVNTMPEIGEMLYESIVEGKSYEKLYVQKYVPISKTDFYGYRKKVLIEFFNKSQNT